jgi:4-amino-4-deoxy-L-arabinose transferase-like glycosyltransferase
MSRLAWLYCLSAIILLYAGLSLYQINLPGLHYDEAFEAVPALQLWRGQPVLTFRNNGLTLGSRTFPFMTQDYIGAINTYIAIPFIALLGPAPSALRLMSVFVGAITIGLAYLLTNQLSGSRRVGLFATLLLAIDPTFIFWSRQGIFVTAITAPIGLAATLCWLRRIRGGSIAWTAAGAFLFGLGLYAKLLFVWLIAALIGAVTLLNLLRLIKQRPEVIKNWKIDFLVAVPTFLMGCWPLIAYNIQTGGTFLNVTQNASTSYYGVNNLAFGPNLLIRLGQFVSLLDGSHLWYLGQIISNPVPVIIFGLVLILVGIGTSLGLAPAATQIALFPFLIIGLLLLASIGTVSALWITHFAILMSWPAIAIALGGWFVSRWQVARFTPHASRLILTIGLVLLIVTNLVSVIRYHRALTESGGLSAHSDAIYDLSEWLANQAGGPIVAMDWGLAAPVTYLTGGRVVPIEVFGYGWESEADLAPRLKSFIVRPAALYLWRAPDEIIFDRSPEFKALYRPLDLEETIEAAFYERSGRPILGVTRLVPQGTAINPPK